MLKFQQKNVDLSFEHFNQSELKDSQMKETLIGNRKQNLDDASDSQTSNSN